jgi:hypothetical protein
VISSLLFSLPAYGQEPPPQTITIGTFTYIGIVAWSPNFSVSAYEVKFDVEGVTLGPIPITRWTIYVGDSNFSEGPTSTADQPSGGWVLLGGDPYSSSPLEACSINCVMIALQVQLSKGGGPVTLTLANGDTFKTAGIVTVIIQALPGKSQLGIRRNQSVPIVLTQIVP